MKNLGSILLLLATSATYVASIPYGDHQYGVRAYDDAEPAPLLAREPKKKNKQADQAAVANATVVANGTVADTGKGVRTLHFDRDT